MKFRPTAVSASLVRGVAAAVVFFCAVTLLAQSTNTLVVPNAQTDVAGDIDNTYPFDVGAYAIRYQQVYAASQFGAMPEGGALITAIAFRLPQGWGSFSNTLPGVQINLSTTAQQPNGLSTTFPANVGTNNTVVFNGPLSLSSSDIGNPPNFDILIPLTTPFFYNPSAGNLLLDVRNSGGGTTSPFDAVSSDGLVSRAFGSISNSIADGTDSDGLVTEFVFVSSQTNAFLPVYQVTRSGATFQQATNLASALNIPTSMLVWSNGLVSFIDPTNYMFVPTVQVTNAAIISNLLAQTKNPFPAIPINVEALDFGALSNLSVMDTNVALVSAGNALYDTGLVPLFGSPVARHTMLGFFCTNGDNSISSGIQSLDTQVSYQFTVPSGYPLIGPGAEVQFAYGSSSNVTRLLYAARQLAAGPSVHIIPLTEASNRVAGLFPPNAQINFRLVYWSPPFQAWPSPAPLWNPTNIIPWYAFDGTIQMTNPVTGSNYTSTLAEQLIPATDDTNYVPSINLSAFVAGSTQIVASVSVSGGRPPYSYLWTGSAPGVSTNTIATITYTPTVRVAPPPLSLTVSSNNTLTIYWPYSSAAFVLESTSNLVAGAWSTVPGLVDTDTGMNSVTISNQSSSAMFFRLQLATPRLPITETLGVTVTDANGVWVQSNQTFTVQAEAVPVVPSDPTYATESPYDTDGFDIDRWSWESSMSAFGGGSESFSYEQYNAWPGDYMEPRPPEGSQYTLPENIPQRTPGVPLWIDADVAGVNTANLVMYMGHSGNNVFSFTWPNFTPINGSYAYSLQLNEAGTDMKASYTDNTNWWNLDLTHSWGNIGPNDRLNWLCFYSCELLQYNANNANDFFTSPNSSGLYIWQRWGGAFNGLHIMMGFHTVYDRPSLAPAAFAGHMLGSSLPIAKSWIDAGSQDILGVQLNPFAPGFGIQYATPVAIGPMLTAGGPTTSAVCDINDCYPGKGTQGPDIQPSQIKGWWWMWAK